MKSKIIGTMIVLLALTNCTKGDIEYIELDGANDISYINKEIKDSINNELKSFGKIDTKVVLEPIWIDGDLISIYSIDDDDNILYIDTCAVFDSNKNIGKIIAEVAKDCKGYFAIFPYDIFNYVVGDHIDFPSNRNLGGYVDYELIKRTSVFGDVNIMTSWCGWVKDDGIFDFSNRVSILRILNMQSNFAPVKLIVERDGDDRIYETSSIHGETTYLPISTVDEYIKHMRFYYKSRSWKTYIEIYPRDTIRVGHIYDIDINNYQ